MKGGLLKFLKDNKAYILFVVLMMVFRSAVADWNDVPTGSMKPTIIEGDRIFVNKMAYDIRLPFTTISLAKLADPVRGDIVIFDSQVSGKRLVKRVVGVPGDVVALQDNVLSVNGNALDYDVVGSNAFTVNQIESMEGAKYTVRINKRGSRYSSFPEVAVPEGYYLALGDNRDESADSRVIGFVPRHEIVGRTRHVALSLDYDNYYLPRKGRFLHTL